MSNAIKAEILIVDDEPNTLASLARAFRLAGHEATVCDNAARALELAKSRSFDLVLSDVVMPGRDGLALLEDLKNSGVAAPVVMMSGQAHVEMAVRATRLGALDFLEKPISTERLLLTVENALRLKRLESENSELRQKVGRHTIVWSGPRMQQVMAQIERVAASETRVCIQGETGTGKELAARTLHEKSARRSGPFITLNCAAVPAELIESELFGHEKGSFTGASTRHAGKFEQAHHGTLFLDEIGDMPLAMQAKLLRVLEEGEVERVGGERPIAVDARVIVATHQDLEAQVRNGKFRQDLFHRVYVFPLLMPPLRERKEEIPLLVEHLARQVCAQNGWKTASFADGAIRSLQQYHWPGNVRELRNVVERLLLLAANGAVDLDCVKLALPATQEIGRAAGPASQIAIPLTTRSDASPQDPSARPSTPSGSPASPQLACGGGTAGAPGTPPLAVRVAQFERESILAELERQHHHITNTAKALGLERSHLYKKCQALGISLRDREP